MFSPCEYLGQNNIALPSKTFKDRNKFALKLSRYNKVKNNQQNYKRDTQKQSNLKV